MSENLKLDKVIEIDGTTYEVQAKTAEKVENKLTIYEVISETAEEPVEFNGYVAEGEEAPEVFIVSADRGGYFRSPIGVPTVGNSPKQDTQVLNYRDLSTVVTNLAGSGWYSWDGDNFGAVTDNGVNQHVGIVIGSSTNLASFATRNAEIAAKTERSETEIYLPKFLYICADNGNLYQGSCENADSYQQIVNQALELVSQTTGQSYTADSLKTKLDTLDRDVAVNATDIQTAVTNLTADYQTADTELDGKIAANANSVMTLSNWLETITETNDTTVKNATYAENANKLDNKDSTYFQKKITVSTNNPTSSDGEVGDIWIVWSNS